MLFAAPIAAQSPWVSKEVDFWCLNKSVDRLLIVQTDGDVVWDAGAGDFDWSSTTALPSRLRGIFKDEPRWIEARWARTSSQTTLKDPRFRDPVAELAAPIRGVPKDELIDDDIQQLRRLETLRNSALARLSLLLAAAMAAALVPVLQRSLAAQRLATAQRSESKTLAMRASTELEGDGPATTVRIALAGVPKDATSGDRPLVAEAEAALLNGMRSMRELRHFGEGQASLVMAVALSPDGHPLVIGFQDGSIEVLDVVSARLLRMLHAAYQSNTTTVSKDGNRISTRVVYDGVALAAFGADGSSIITVDASATASIWDAASGRPRAQLRGVDDLKLAFRSVSASTSRDGRFVVLTGVAEPDDSRAVLWDSVSGKVSVLRYPPGPGDQSKVLRQVAFATFGVNGRSLVTGSTDWSIWLWDVAEARPLKSLTGHTGGLVFTAFGTDGRRIVTAARDDTARLWDRGSGELLATFRGRGGNINGAALSPDGWVLLTAHEDGTAWPWDIAGTQAPKLLSGHRGAVKSASFSGDGRNMLTTSADGTARLLAAVSASEIAVLRGHCQPVEQGLFSPDGLQVFSRDHHAVRLWNATAMGDSTPVRTAHDGEIRSVVFSGDDRRLVTAGWDNTAQLSDTQSGRAQTVFHHPVLNVESASLSPDGRRMLTVAGDGTARVWDVATPDKVINLSDPDGPVRVAAFSPDGETLATVTNDDLVRLWDVASHRVLGTVGRHSDASAVSFSRDGLRLASAGYDLRIWPLMPRR